MLRASALTSAAVTLFMIAVLHGAGVSRLESDAFARKLALITRHAESAKPVAARRTAISEGELNSWFAFRSQRLLPLGVAPPSVAIVGNGKLKGDVVLDLEAYAKSRRSGGALDPWNLITGKLPVTVTGVLHTKDGQGRFELQGAELSGIPLPRVMLQELVTYYSRTPERPQGIRLDDAFDLPANIRRIEVGQGQAVVVQ